MAKELPVSIAGIPSGLLVKWSQSYNKVPTTEKRRNKRRAARAARKVTRKAARR